MCLCVDELQGINDSRCGLACLKWDNSKLDSFSCKSL